MKGGVLVGLAAIEELARSGSGAAVELHCVPDEEGRNVAPYTLASMRGADAALCLECGRESGAIVTSRKAGCWVTITAHGVPAHAGTSPDEGRSALRALARELLRIEGELHRSRPGMTAVATQLHAGEVKNTVPAEAWGVIDVRALDDADLDYALGRIRAVGHHDGVVFAFSDDRGFPPMRRAPELADATLRALAAQGAAGARGGRGRRVRRLLDEPCRRPDGRRPRPDRRRGPHRARVDRARQRGAARGRDRRALHAALHGRRQPNVITPRPGAPERRSS